ncbi:hypothetical protein O181_012651 [Austropuccinia psidii MF-1]|uniref:Reverse transcriptase Ty1/copia-type domain-containing protein n=1 Tax=Austropuccinia psidii MF-1 TaxID=1389203 RepID=A0A9Q3BUZ7_9BASI|nr:hypothetical protein [Austropuccinia psidii MF-1]
MHIHVNNAFIIGVSRTDILKLLESLKKHYSLKIKEKPTQHLCCNLKWKDYGAILVHQANFCDKRLSEFNMSDSNPVKTPTPFNLHYKPLTTASNFELRIMQKAMGMLNYLALHTRPINHATKQLQ